MSKAQMAMFIFFISMSLPGCKKEKWTAENKPNIIILADDAGYADFGFMGSDLHTPNIDKLPQSGVVFTNTHITASICSPSWAGLMTGRYQQRSGHEAISRLSVWEWILQKRLLEMS